MEIIELYNGQKWLVVILPVEEKDLKVLTKRRYSFDWKTEWDKAALYKLTLAGGTDILGVIGLVDVPGDSRIWIKLIANSLENTGKNKHYEGIAGCMIAFACNEALQKYSTDACVSLIPKTALRRHYIEKYGMFDAWEQVFLEDEALNDIIKKYKP